LVFTVEVTPDEASDSYQSGDDFVRVITEQGTVE
jgi:hypothetical protein